MKIKRQRSCAAIPTDKYGIILKLLIEKAPIKQIYVHFKDLYTDTI